VIVITDETKRERLMKLCANQKHILEAPVFMAWCADLSRLERVCALQGYEHYADNVENFILASVDATLAMQNAALAAESLGLGFCYIGGIRNNSRDVIELLGLPQKVFPLNGMTLGWPQEPPEIRPRLPLEAVLHWDQYDANDIAALEEYNHTMIESGIYAGKKRPRGKEVADQDYGWLEHSARLSSRNVRPEIIEVLREMGFGMK
jgi:FMN reductase (NADPH)